MLSSRERREKTSGTQKLEILWQNKSTSKIGVERVSLQCSAVAEADVFQRSHGMDPRFPDFQEMNLRPEELFKMWQELWRWIFLFWVLRLLTLLWEKRQLSTYGHQRCCWEFEDLSFCQPFSANSGNIPSQVNYGTRHFLYHPCTFVHVLYPGMPSSGSFCLPPFLSIQLRCFLLHDSLNFTKKKIFFKFYNMLIDIFYISIIWWLVQSLFAGICSLCI